MKKRKYNRPTTKTEKPRVNVLQIRGSGRFIKKGVIDLTAWTITIAQFMVFMCVRSEFVSFYFDFFFFVFVCLDICIVRVILVIFGWLANFHMIFSSRTTCLHYT